MAETWEYAQVTHTESQMNHFYYFTSANSTTKEEGKFGDNDLVVFLNKAGVDGWELVCSVGESEWLMKRKRS